MNRAKLDFHEPRRFRVAGTPRAAEIHRRRAIFARQFVPCRRAAVRFNDFLTGATLPSARDVLFEAEKASP